MKKISLFLLVIVSVSLLFHACDKKDKPPSLPPAKSMTIDFSNFTASNKSAFLVNDNKANAVLTNTNWFLASTIAGFWNVILAVNLVIPVAAFEKAIDNKPVYLENKKWQWSYSVNVVGAVYNARLTGQIESNDVKWEMYISKDGAGAFPEFLWFDGTSALDGNSGQWILYASRQYQDPMLQIDWILNGTNIGGIKYTYIRELKDNGTADTFNSSYIEYGLTTSTLNAFYNTHLNVSGTANDFKDAYIEWNTTAHNGHIKAFYYFQDSNWHCWDTTGKDVTCN